MSRVIDKKQRERWQLETFRASYSDFPPGNITPSEEPDFLIENDGKVIGIELTGIYRPPTADRLPMQASESLMNQVVERARAIYEESGGPALWVSVLFSSFPQLRKSQVSELAAKLARIVSDKNVKVGGSVRIENDWEDTDYFPEAFYTINIRHSASLTKGFWSVPTAAFIPQLAADDIQQTIDKKDTLCPTYRKKCQEAWLLIVYGSALSSTFEMPNDVREHEYRSNFDRVFMCDVFSQVTVELNIES
ncbi:MAG TPA: hypothetical protein VF723_11235 [Pyrinomonadaceae bacterium]|jgi:hypothetical protein